MGRSFFRFLTIHAFVRQTDGWTERPCNTVCCITCSRTVKIGQHSTDLQSVTDIFMNHSILYIPSQTNIYFILLRSIAADKSQH